MVRVSPKTAGVVAAALIVPALIGLAFLLRPGAALTPSANCPPAIGAAAQYDCYSKYFRQVVDTAGAPAALASLDSLQTTDPYVRGHCHPLVHTLGRAAYEHYGSVEAAVQYENGLCFTGFTHGIMEAYMSGFDDAKLAAAMPNICHQSGTRLTLPYYNCLHGLGHGAMIRFDSDVFQALPFCDKLTGTWAKNACFNGVFMQNVVVDGADHISRYLKSDDPLYPCDAVEDRMMDPCYLIQGSHLLDVTSRDFAKAFAWCDKAAAAYINSCYQSLGREASASASDARQVVGFCSQGNPAFQGYCYGAAAGDFVYRRQKPADADPLCEATPDRYKPDCRAGQKATAALL